MNPTDVHFKTRIIAGPETAGRVGELAAGPALVITDKGLVDAGVASTVCSALDKHVVFSEIPPDSSVKAVSTAVECGRKFGATCIVAVGGGSVMDSAKCCAIGLSQDKPFTEFQGSGAISFPLIPIICIPTTAGTGSEVTNVALVLDEEHHEKLVFYDNALVSHCAILDPMLTLKLPAHITAATGADALTHAIEGLVAVNSNPVSTGFATSAISTILKYLPRAVRDGNDLEARYHMLVAANHGGYAFMSSGVGVVHACAHSMGAYLRVHHGHANAVFLPKVLDLYFRRKPEMLAELSRVLGVPPLMITEFISEFLFEKCGVPVKVDRRADEVMMTRLVENAKLDGSMIYSQYCPDEVEFRELFKSVLS